MHESAWNEENLQLAYKQVSISQGIDQKANSK
jgi:hypothetical protein